MGSKVRWQNAAWHKDPVPWNRRGWAHVSTTTGSICSKEIKSLLNFYKKAVMEMHLIARGRKRHLPELWDSTDASMALQLPLGEKG